MTTFHQIFVKADADGEETHDGSSKYDEWFQVSCQTEEEKAKLYGCSQTIVT